MLDEVKHDGEQLQELFERAGQDKIRTASPALQDFSHAAGDGDASETNPPAMTAARIWVTKIEGKGRTIAVQDLMLRRRGGEYEAAFQFNIHLLENETTQVGCRGGACHRIAR